MHKGDTDTCGVAEGQPDEPSGLDTKCIEHVVEPPRILSEAFMSMKAFLVTTLVAVPACTQDGPITISEYESGAHKNSPDLVIESRRDWRTPEPLPADYLEVVTEEIDDYCGRGRPLCLKDRWEALHFSMVGYGQHLNVRMFACDGLYCEPIKSQIALSVEIRLLAESKLEDLESVASAPQ